MSRLKQTFGGVMGNVGQAVPPKVKWRQTGLSGRGFAMALIIRAVAAADRAGWEQLYAGYAAFYKVAQTEAMRATVWQWLHDLTHGSEGLVAEQDGVLIGLAHFRPFARPLSASTGGYLDDLFVALDARGSGAAAALLEAVKAAGAARGWTVIRWITADDNYRARGLYDQLAERTKWVTYDIKL
jgi:GNAT superfamily N-acetyltransferase